MQPCTFTCNLRQLRFPAASTINLLHKTVRLNSTRSASDKLSADAEREESDSETSQNDTKSQILNALSQHENWTGDERIQDAVLRMLVDKYKPLRGSNIITAEEKLKRSPPKVRASSTSVDDGSISVDPTSGLSNHLKPRSGSWATEPLLPSNPSHKPWETTYKVPTDGAPVNIKAAHIPPLGTPGGIDGLGPGNLDERLVRKEKEKMKKSQQIGRLSQALESTLDYRLGIKRGRDEHGQPRKPNPVSLKGWNNLVEERIEKARSAGVFKNVKGRGQPLVRSVDESNPFIAREEFLMNRIIQRNGAAPPWVEVQYELESAVETFRSILRQSWVRRAIRLLNMRTQPELLHRVTLDQIKALRDPDWVKKERSYHEVAVAELNSLLRKYNGLAPYHVRRSCYFSRDLEIDRMYETSAEDIMQELRKRLRESDSSGRSGIFGDAGITSGPRSGSADSVPSEDIPPSKIRFRDLIRGWLDDLTSSWSKPS